MRRLRPTAGERVGAAAITAALVAALGGALLAGLSVRFVPAAETALASFDVAPPAPPPPPPPPPAPRPAPAPRPEGAAAPPSLTARATELAAPRPVIATPPTLVTTQRPAAGSEATSGNAPIPGSGPGSGGIGNGTGSGDAGNGPGGGGGTPPRLIHGRIHNSDYPKAAGAAGVSGTVSVLYVVAPSGRVTDCEVTHSSGSALLDDTTCDLIIARFRYDPARDAEGRPVESMVEENHHWIVE
ncbi:MAG TPA: energy transducer TonB [Sphingomonas sp.]|nr:energy transducer TonB [Sphingomonas sp.]